MNKRSSDGSGSCKVYGVANTAEVTNIVLVIDTGDGGDLLGKREGGVKDETEIFSRRNCRIG